MPRSTGTYTAPSNSFNPAVEGTAIDETDWNATLDDIESALSESVYTGGLGSSDNRLVRTDGTDTKKVQGTGITVDDSDNVSGVASITAATINVGNADTSLTRTGAGDIAVEGNAIYRAGGTDVPIADGGTGASTAAGGARALLEGLSATQGAVLYRDGTQWTALAPGSIGQVLQSGGAGADPSWATVAGTGDVTAASAFGTDNRALRSDGTGKGAQASPVTIDDSGNVSGVGTISTSGVATVGTTSATAVKIDPSGFVEFPEVSAPSTPASGFLRLYAKTDGKTYQKNDAGTETDLSQTGGGASFPALPQGRLTLTTLTPIMSSTVNNATTVFYTPCTGQFVPLYDGTSYTMTDVGGELSQATTDSTKSPAACTTNSNYDLFVWNDSGTYRCTRGPAWSSDTSRGVGAGTTELERVRGILLNKVSITNGPAANRGTYVGTVRTNGSSQIDWQLAAVGSGGTPGLLGVWNAYNRVNVTTMVGESDNFWTYTTAAWRPYNNSSNNRVSFVRGLDEDAVNADFTGWGDAGNTSNILGFAVGLDSTSAFSGQTAGAQLINTVTFGVRSMATAKYSGLPGIGWHFVQALEYCQGGTCTFLGDGGNSPVIVQTGMTVTLRA